ncbi:MAG: cytochrome c oxidase subunit I [Chloroflexi bacterium]|nr:cytochrome c oxidase subunit I [Chloroflexota bacterium]
MTTFFFLVGGIEAGLMRMQLAAPNQDLVSAQNFNALFTMHGTTMIFLGVMPLSAMFFNYMIPLMIGARDVAFPRLNAFSYWVFLFGALFINLSWFVGHPPDGGWFGYSNLTSRQYSITHSIDFWMLGLQILGIASMAAAFNFIVTIINLRAPGLTLNRLPVFIWMSLVTNILLVLAFPAITVALILLMFDRFFGTNFYNPFMGGDVVLWQHLFWVFGHPEVYILVLPAMGIVSEVLPTFARKPLFGYQFVVYSGIAIGFMSFGVWAHHMFAVGMGPIADSVFALNTMLIAVPTGVKIFNWVGTLWGGSLRFNTAMWFSVGFIAMFIIGGLSGVMHASPPADLQQSDTYFIVAHFHYVLVGGALFGIFSGMYFWFPKMSGRMLNEAIGQAHFWLFTIGFNMVFFPMHFMGLDGMPRRIYTYSPEMGWGPWNALATIGVFVLAAGILLFVFNVIWSLNYGEVASNDPWDGATLEWTIPSPPPEYNFAVIPTVTSARSFWDEKYPETVHHGRHRPAAAPAAVEIPASVHMPNPSYWPLVTGFGVALMFGGLIVGPALSAVGALIIIVGITGWSLEPAG